MKKFALVALPVLLFPAWAAAQCPDPGFAGGEGYDGDEPAQFTHYVDEDRDGSCDRIDGTILVVATLENGDHPNGFYPDCDVDDIPGIDESAGDQVGHGHWEYTHRQIDPQDHGKTPAETEEKDYLTLPQAMQEDFENRDQEGTASRESFGQTIRFTANEPVRFDRFLRPGANPSGRYWQVDEWIGPAANGDALPGLTWNERFFACGAQDRLPEPCVAIDGRPAFGGYWSDHAERFGGIDDCGDPHAAYPGSPRDSFCGTLFGECN